jgi:cytosine/adenosine deaminase-related metal-dependent hydrolase
VTDLLIRDVELAGTTAGDGRASIAITAGRIASMGPAPQEPAREIIDGSSLIAMPALVNAHVHSMEVFQRGSVCCLPLEIYRLRIVAPESSAPPTPEEVYVRTLAACVEMLKNGIALAFDDVLHEPFLNVESWDAVLRAYSDSGMRAIVSMHLEDVPWHRQVPFLDGDEAAAAFGAGFSLPDAQEAVAVCREFLGRRPAGSGRVRPMVAPSAPQRCTDELLAGLAACAAEAGAPLHVHALETPVQAVTGPELFGGSLIARLDELGALGPRTTVAHAVWVDDDDIELLAGRGANVSHNPVSNLKLGSGIAPVLRLRDAGINVALGCDGFTCNDGQSIFEAMKMASLLSSVTTPDYDRWLTPADVLEMATVAGRRAAGLDGGTLAPGEPADIVLLRGDTTSFLSPGDRLQQAIYGGAQVDTVIVDGEVVLRDGRTVRIDEEAVLEEAARYARERRSHQLRDGVVGPHAEASFRRAYWSAIERLGPAWQDRMGAAWPARATERR